MVMPATPDLMPPPPPRPFVPRIGGTAMPGGVHFSSGNYGTGPNHLLFLTGVAIMGLGAAAVSLAYVVVALAGYFTGLPLSDAFMDLAGGADVAHLPLVMVAKNLVIFLSFLVVLRLSPMSGYHGAEHKVVSCLEVYGALDPQLVWSCSRVHRRCGTTLLAGFLPVPFVAVPLLAWPVYGPAAAIAVVAIGWYTRFWVGAAIQAIFTTKEPTQRQMDAALRAGHLLLERWNRDPYRKLPLWRSIWVRGFPQMFAGVIVAVQLLSWLQTQLPFWMDFGHVLH